MQEAGRPGAHRRSDDVPRWTFFQLITESPGYGKSMKHFCEQWFEKVDDIGMNG
jgi:hypothetical protein